MRRGGTERKTDAGVKKGNAAKNVTYIKTVRRMRQNIQLTLERSRKLDYRIKCCYICVYSIQLPALARLHSASGNNSITRDRSRVRSIKCVYT